MAYDKQFNEANFTITYIRVSGLQFLDTEQISNGAVVFIVVLIFFLLTKK